MTDWQERRSPVGTAEFVPGTLTRGRLALAEHIGSTVTAPVMIATGARPGPVLWAQAAIHGGEVGGTIALARLLARLDPAVMSGAVVAVLAANPLAFQAQARNTPQDGENMNRVFPGAPDGPLTRQMAHRLMQAAMAASDAVVDLHSGGVEAVVPYYALYWQDGTEASRRAGMLARATGAATIWTATDAWLSGSLMVQLTRAGKPALIVECGGGGPMPDEHIGLFASAVENIAHEMGILPGKPVLPSRQRLIGSCRLVFAREGGFFVPACGPGDILEGGAAFGQIVDVYGDRCETIVSDKRAFVAAVGRPWLPVHSGALIGELNDDLGFEDKSG